jgi:predicted nucleic acid-binding protein
VILADSSALVEYLRGTDSNARVRVQELLDTQGPLAVTEPVAMEVLAGARDEAQAQDLRRLLLRFTLLRFYATIDFDGAVGIYRRCRAGGVTPRGMIDCMIAAVAKRNGVAVLAHDVDFARMASVIQLELDAATLRS